MGGLDDVCEVVVGSSADHDGASVLLEEALALHVCERGQKRNKVESLFFVLFVWIVVVECWYFNDIFI